VIFPRLSGRFETAWAEWGKILEKMKFWVDSGRGIGYNEQAVFLRAL
jgi:hypothetical protein